MGKRVDNRDTTLIPQSNRFVGDQFECISFVHG